MKETYGEICSCSAPSLGSLFDNFRTLFKKILHKKIYTVYRRIWNFSSTCAGFRQPEVYLWKVPAFVFADYEYRNKANFEFRHNE